MNAEQINEMDEQIPVLEFRYVTVEAGADYDAACEKLNFTLRPGELMLVFHPPEIGRAALPDAAQGICRITRGDILFQGEAMKRISGRAGARMRGHTGRTFHEGGWVSNLNVDENILLRLRHHSLRTRKKLLEEVTALAARMGLPALPRRRPVDVDAATLQVAQWVRALAGQPRLIVLDRPETKAPPDRVAQLQAEVNAIREGGAAALWITDQPATWECDTMRVDQRYRYEGMSLRAC